MAAAKLEFLSTCTKRRSGSGTLNFPFALHTLVVLSSGMHVESILASTAGGLLSLPTVLSVTVY